MTHRCHVPDCTTTVAPRLLMCKAHWRIVPAFMQRAVWDTYVVGQETRKDPTPEYLEAARRAVDLVVRRNAPL